MVGKILMVIGIGLFVAIISWSSPDLVQEMIGMAIFGALMSFFGYRMYSREQRALKEIQKILQEGVVGETSITFIDRNYRVQINEQPVYSIIEYAYADSSSYYTKRIDNADTDVIICAGWQVGTTIRIKYLSENSRQSKIIMPEF